MGHNGFSRRTGESKSFVRERERSLKLCNDAGYLVPFSLSDNSQDSGSLLDLCICGLLYLEYVSALLYTGQLFCCLEWGGSGGGHI